MRSINRTQILIGAMALIIGLLVYLTGRPAEQTYFVYSVGRGLSLHDILPDLFFPLGKNLPAFIHVFSFSLITAGLLTRRKRGYLVVCLAWFLTNFVFEFGQRFSTLFSGFVPNFFSGIPLLENAKSFFLQGTFDIYDLVAMAIGAITAYVVLSMTMKRGYAL